MFCCEVVKKKQTKLQVHWLVAYTASCFNIVFCPNPSWKNQEGVRCPRTSCPPGHLVLGLDVPPHNLATEFNVEVLVDHGEMEFESPLQLFGFQSLSCQPVLQRTNATLFDASASSTFARSTKCSTTLHAVGSVNETMCLYTSCLCR